jgi:hypothetical protein
VSVAPLIVGEAQRANLRSLRDRAAGTPFDMRKIMALMETDAGRAQHFAAMREMTIPIPMAFAVTFTIETGHPSGTCRHMSMSSSQKGRAPTPEAIWMIAEELGFSGGLTACHVWQEDIGNADVAINIAQPIAVMEAAEA